MSETHVDRVLDAKGLKCPMPVVKARKELLALEPGQVLQILSTDRGSIKDFQGWAKVERKIDLVEQETLSEGEDEVYAHYIQRTS